MKKQNGFTLIELVIVIIVLGILAATAVPKFINLQDDAKESALKGAEAAIRSAANISYSKSAIDGIEKTSGTADSSKGTVNTKAGYPTAAGIVAAVELSGFTASTPIAGDSVTFTLDSAGSSPVISCQLTYTQASGAGSTYKLSFGPNTSTIVNTPSC
ncbi:MSHA pilin protein MshA [Moritella viscosa]|uniref:type II secretion system protein n=1 Tax=Moritella viscosa TaxID=80854 RepID=UPI00050901F8|nr:type II secretion system protein [Moritella viscosa]CED62119.1 type IV pilus, mannose-sensitive hemagglutinin A [Moritella viscosa]SHO07290.1 MSHA pilin protein MshA [Moritella viscosa]SHO07384.1 MSHA pilin protein MshA [Moritella viscosa]SHO08323.1 MSHA pilin protein MshA [Moritella viscosa]SHO11264.1 MSHA pilin protein MshA [Moritella viscosa]